MHNREVLGHAPAREAGQKRDHVEARTYHRVPPAVEPPRRPERMTLKHRHAVTLASVVEADARHRPGSENELHPGALDDIRLPVLEIGYDRDAVARQARVMDASVAHEEDVFAGIKREDL